MQNYIKKGWSWYRRRFRWWIRWLITSFVGLILFYAIEDARGWLALKEAKTTYQAAGRSLNWEEILGSTPPEHDNFGAVDYIVALYETEGKESIFPTLSYDGPTHPRERAKRAAGIHRPADLPIDFLPRDFPDDSHLRGAAVIELFEQQRSTLSRIAKDLRLPECRYPMEFGINSKLYHLPLFQTVRDLCSIRALANHDAGRYDEAVTDWQSCDLLSRKLCRQQSLVSYTIGMAIRQLNLCLIWYFLEQEGMSQSHLKELEESLEQRASIVDELDAAIEIDVAVWVETLGTMMVHRGEGIELFEAMSGYGLYDVMFLPDSLYHLNDLMIKAAIAISPRGWWWQNQAGMLNGAIEIFERRTAPAEPITTPYNFFAKQMGYPSGALVQIDKAEILNQLAILAIRLERYKIANGNYPATFDLPSKSYGYQLGRNGRPILYFDTGSRSQLPIEESEFDGWNRQHLWRY